MLLCKCGEYVQFVELPDGRKPCYVCYRKILIKRQPKHRVKYEIEIEEYLSQGWRNETKNENAISGQEEVA